MSAATDRPSAPRPVLVAGALLGAAIVACAPLFATGIDTWGINDWDQHFSHIESARRAVVTWGQLPLWDPYQCGGVELLASPSSLILSPSFLLVLLLGTVPGIKVAIVLHLWLGLAGTYLLAGRYGLSGAARLVPPVGFMLSSAYALHVSAGAIEWLAMGWLPWSLWLVHRACEAFRPRDVVAAAGTFALAFLGGGNYFVIYTGLVCAGLVVVRVLQTRSPRPLLVLVLVGLLAGALAAPKLLPGVVIESSFPRTVPMFGVRELPVDHFARGGVDGLGGLLFRVFVHRRQAELMEVFTTYWVEYGTYLGVPVLLLALAGIVRWFRRFPELAIMPGVFLVVGLGSRSPVSLWGSMTSLPLLRNLNHPSRLFVVVALFASLAAGLGMAWLVSALRGDPAGGDAGGRPGRRRRAAAWLGALVVVVVGADLVTVAWPVWRSAFTVPPVETPAAPGAFRQTMYLKPALAAVRANRGIIDAYNHNGRPRSAIASSSPLYRGEAYLASGAGTVEWERFSPLALDLRYRAGEADRLVVNQNAAPGWRVVSGGELVEEARRLTVAVPPGEGVVSLRYSAPGLAAGLLISLITGVACAAWIAGYPGRRWGRAALGVSLAGFVAGAASYANRPPVPAQEELRRAREATFREHHAEAAAAWGTVVAEYPDYYLGQSRLGRELLLAGRAGEARAPLERAVLLAPLSRRDPLRLLQAWQGSTGTAASALPISRSAALEATRHYASTGQVAIALALLRSAVDEGVIDAEEAVRDRVLRLLPDDAHAARILGTPLVERLRDAAALAATAGNGRER